MLAALTGPSYPSVSWVRRPTFDVAGKPTSWEVMALFRLHEGKIVEERVFRDELGMLLQVEALKPV